MDRLEKQRAAMGRTERSVTCAICGSMFSTYYQHKKTCSEKCSLELREKNRRTGAKERLNKWRKNNPEKYKENYTRYLNENREKVREWGKKSRSKMSPERRRESNRNWYKKDPLKKGTLCHKRRKAIQSIGGDQEQMRKRLKMFDQCVYCGSHDNLTIEHLVPISKGGTNDTYNLFIACRKCNSSKNNKQFLTWYRSQSFYDPIKEFNILQMTLAG